MTKMGHRAHMERARRSTLVARSREGPVLMQKLNIRRDLTFGLLLSLVGCGGSAGDAPVDDQVKKSMDDFARREIHRTLDPETLASIPDDKVEQAVVDYVVTKMDGHYEKEARIVAALPPGARSLYLTWVVEAEVNNGGFNQYYWNTSDQFAEAAAEAFEFFSAADHAALMREANRVRAQEKAAMERFKRQGTVEAFSKSYDESKLGPLDERFYKLEEHLSTLRIKKIRAVPLMFSGT